MDNYENIPMDLSRTMPQNGILSPPAHSLQQAGYFGADVPIRLENGRVQIIYTGNQTRPLNLPSTPAIVQEYSDKPQNRKELTHRIRWLEYRLAKAKKACERKEKQQNPQTLDIPTTLQTSTATQSTNHNVLYPPPHPVAMYNQQAPARLINYCCYRHLIEQLVQSYDYPSMSSPVCPACPVTGRMAVVKDYYNYDRSRTLHQF